MRNLILIAAPLALVACSEEAVEEPVADDTMAEAEVEAPGMVTANGTAPGAYTVTSADGSTSMTTTNSDGTYQSMDADGTMTEEGTWAVVDGQTCFTSNEADAEPECWDEGAPGADGSFTATRAGDGMEVTVSPNA